MTWKTKDWFPKNLFSIILPWTDAPWRSLPKILFGSGSFSQQIRGYFTETWSRSGTIRNPSHNQKPPLGYLNKCYWLAQVYWTHSTHSMYSSVHIVLWMQVDRWMSYFMYFMSVQCLQTMSYLVVGMSHLQQTTWELHWVWQLKAYQRTRCYRWGGQGEWGNRILPYLTVI